MKIVYIMHYAGSPHYGMAFRPHSLAKEWVKQGHHVTIVAASFSHLRAQQPVMNRDIQKEDIDGINYLWIKTPEYQTPIKRIVNILSFVGKLTRYAKRVAKEYDPDWVIASSCYPFDIYPAKKIAKLSKAKICFEVHDIWPLTPMLIGGYSKYHPFIFTMQVAENCVCRHSDKIISLLWNAEAHYREHGFKGEFYCVRNGYFKEDWTKEALEMTLPEEHTRLFTELKKDNKMIVGFAGGLAAASSLITMLEAAQILMDNKNVQFVLVGKGPEKEKLVTFSEQERLDNVHFLPPVTKAQIPVLISKFDITYMGGIHSILHGYGTCQNKLTDYMLSEKPIVMSIDEPGSLVDQTGCGIRVEAENAPLVANAIKRIVDMSVEERIAMGHKGQEYVVKNLEWGILAERFIEYLNIKN